MGPRAHTIIWHMLWFKGTQGNIIPGAHNVLVTSLNAINMVVLIIPHGIYNYFNKNRTNLIDGLFLFKSNCYVLKFLIPTATILYFH